MHWKRSRAKTKEGSKEEEHDKAVLKKKEKKNILQLLWGLRRMYLCESAMGNGGDFSQLTV